MGDCGEVCVELYFTLMDNTIASLIPVLDVMLVLWPRRRMCLLLEKSPAETFRSKVLLCVQLTFKWFRKTYREGDHGGDTERGRRARGWANKREQAVNKGKGYMGYYVLLKKLFLLFLKNFHINS